jgi:hypothetical protein
VNPLVCTVPTLAVSAIYCLWHGSWRLHFQRRQKLAERVAYMLWVAAQHVPDEPEAAAPKKATSPKGRSGPILPGR